MRNIRDFEHWEIVADGPLPEFVVEWESITRHTLQEFRRLLDEERGERSLQAFLQCYPTVLIQILSGGQRRWAIPQKRLGEKHVTDFILGEFNSLGYHWYPVELESPIAGLFTKTGDPTKALTHTVRQIQDWRLWLNQNLDYARRSRVEGGLELIKSGPTRKESFSLGGVIC
jgi:antiviral defense system Shedu protein SduA